jgi:hypothetical protein
MGINTKSAALAAVFLGMFVASARAEEIITVNIPFAFVVDRHEYPAGQYDVRRSDDSADVVWIEGMTNRSAAAVLTVRADGRDPAGAQPALVFTRSQRVYQLSQIWESPSNGREITEPSGTRHGGRSAAESGGAETLTIAAAAK